MAKIFQDWYQGIGRSRADQQGFAYLKNCDVHSEVGFIQPQLALETDNRSNVPTEACIFCKTPAGTIYAFSTTSGKIWKLTNGSTWTLVLTNSVTTGHRGASYYGGAVSKGSPARVYFATATSLGYFTAETQASPNYTWKTVGAGTLSNSDYRPMEEVNLTLFIGNGLNVASINSNSTWNKSALDVPKNATVTALANVGVDLLVGTAIGNQVNHCSAFLWDTYSDSWTIEDVVPEVSVNCFIKNDEIVFAQCGNSGQLYYWNGSSMVKFRKIPNTTTGVAPYNSQWLNGGCLFAANGNIFSIYREDQDLPYALVHEYTTVSGNVNALMTYGPTLIVSAGTHINKTGTDYADAEITTPEVTGNVDKIIVNYDTIETGASIEIDVQIDQDGSYTSKTVITDVIKRVAYFDGGLGDVNFMQGRITLNSNGANKVKIRSIQI